MSTADGPTQPEGRSESVVPAKRGPGPGIFVFPALCLVGAVVVWVTSDATLRQIVLPSAVAVAAGLGVTLIASHTRRFRVLLLLGGWAAAGFVPAALVQAPTSEPLAGLLLYIPAMFWSSLLFDIQPETFRGDEKYRRPDSDANR